MTLPQRIRRTPIVLALTLIAAMAEQTASSQPCKPPVSINEVRYVGKVDGNDRVKVAWSLGAGCLGAPGSTFTVKAKVTRRLGHVDEGSAPQKVATGQLETTVTIPRGALETDPREFTVTISGTGAGNTSASAAGDATLAEASAASGKTFAEPAAPSNPCAISAGVVKLAYKGRSGGKDRVEVSWRAKSACTRPVDGRVTAFVISQSGQSSQQAVTVTHPPTTTTTDFNVAATTTIEVPVTGTDPIARLAVSLTETGRSSETVSASKSGSF